MYHIINGTFLKCRFDILREIFKYFSKNTDERKIQDIPEYVIHQYYIYPKYNDNYVIQSDFILYDKKSSGNDIIDQEVIFDNIENNRLESITSFPCIFNDVLYDNDNDYIIFNNLSQNMLFNIVKISKISNVRNSVRFDIDCYDTTNERNINIDNKSNNIGTIIDDLGIDGFYVGKWGKLNNLRNIHGFKKSLFYRIKLFYKRYDEKIMVMFHNNISVWIDLLNIDNFIKTSKHKIKKDTFVYNLSEIDKLSLSSRYLKKYLFSHVIEITYL